MFSWVASISTPSRMMRGSVAPLNVEAPRIQKLAPSAPGSPLRCTAITPDKRPAKEEDKREEGTLSCSGRICWIAPTRLSFFCPIPKAVTTTSSNALVSSSSWMLSILFFPTFTSWVIYPINETIRTGFSSSSSSL